MKVAVDDGERTALLYVVIKVPTLGIHPAVVRAGDRVRLAGLPVTGGHILVVGQVIAAVVAAERSAGTFLQLMIANESALEKLRTVDALDLGKVATHQAVFTRLGVLVQVLAKLSQLTSPRATILLVRAANVDAIEGALEPLVRKSGEIFAVARRTRVVTALHLLDARSAVAVPTASDLVGLPKYQ